MVEHLTEKNLQLEEQMNELSDEKGDLVSGNYNEVTFSMTWCKKTKNYYIIGIKTWQLNV